MVTKIWKWLKRIWFTLLKYIQGKNNHVLVSEQNHLISISDDGDNSQQYHSLKDQDLAFLFHQLLEGVANGWQVNQVEQFFQRLVPRVTIEIWLEWLQKYRSQLLTSPSANYQSAARMITLGEVTASLPFLRPVGDLAYEIGEELLNHSDNNPLVDSLRPSLQTTEENSTPKTQSNGDDNQDKISSDQINSEVEQASSLGEVLHLLQNNPDLAEATANKLGLNKSNPGTIVEKLLENTESSLESPELNSEAQTESRPDSSQPSTSTIQSSSQDLDELFNLGLSKAEQGDLEGAIAAWDQVLQVDTDIAQAWHNRGSALAYLNQLTEAIESFEQAIAINVNDYQSWNDRGNALYNLGHWEEAIISWDRVIAIQPDHHQAWYNRGLALEKLQLWQEALESYQQALEIEPDFTQAQHRYQQLESRTQKKEEIK